MSGECTDCKWWGEEDSDLPGYRICKLTVNDGMMDFAYPKSKALATGTGFSSSARLATAADFGCNEWEEDSEIIECGEVVDLSFKSRSQLGWTARGRAFEHRWRDFQGAMPIYDYGWERAPRHDKGVG